MPFSSHFLSQNYSHIFTKNPSNQNNQTQPKKSATLTFSLLSTTFIPMKLLILLSVAVALCQPPENHSPQASQFGNSSFFEPRGPELDHDFFKHYATFKLSQSEKLILDRCNTQLRQAERENHNQTKFGMVNELNCDITCIMLSIATRTREKQNNIWYSQIGKKSQSETITGWNKKPSSQRLPFITLSNQVTLL